MGIRPGRVFTGWFVLVVLYTALTESERLTQALGIGNSALTALSDPNRPLIRDHSATTAPPPASAPPASPPGRQAPTSADPSGNPLFGQLGQLNPLSPDGANPLFGPIPLSPH